MQVELFIIISTAIGRVLSQCKPSKIAFINFQEKPKRSIVFTVEATATKCPGKNEFYYEWEVNDDLDATMQTSRDSYIGIDGYKYPSEDIFDIEFTLTLTICHEPDMILSNSKTGTFTFVPEEMKILIVGGIQRTHPLGSDLTIDANTLSRDYSYPPTEDYFAGNIISWTVNPPLPEISSNTLILHVSKDLLQLNQEYQFTVTVVRNKIPNALDKKTATQIVKIVSVDSPVIEIQCERNCQNSNPKQTTLVKVVCTKNCTTMSYMWQVTPNVDPTKMQFGNGFSKLLIDPDGFNAGDNVEFSVSSASASASYEMTFVENLITGSCSITPSDGISGITVFTVSCHGFSSSAGIETYMIYQKSDLVLHGVLLNVAASATEYKVLLSQGSPATVVVRVQDNAFMQAEIELTVNVRPFSESVAGSTNLDINAIKRLVLNDDTESVITLAEKGNTNQVVQMVFFLLDAINEITLDENTKKDLHRHMAESLFIVDSMNFPSAVQIISVLTKLQKLKLESDTDTSRIVSKAMMKASDTVYKLIMKKGIDIPTTYTNEFINDVLNLSSDLLTPSENIGTKLDVVIASHDYDSYDEMEPDKLRTRDNLREIAESSMISMEILGTALMHLNSPDQRATSFQNELIGYKTQRITLEGFNGRLDQPNVTESNVFLPTTVIDYLRESYMYIEYQFVVFEKNPFYWHTTKSKLTTDFILFNIYADPLKLLTLDIALELNMKVKQVPVGEISGTVDDSHYNGIAAHLINLDRDANLFVIFDPSNTNFKVTSSECFCKASDFGGATEILPGATESERTFRVQPKLGMSKVYLCIMKQTGSTLSYRGRMASFNCVHWNLKTGHWVSEGCRLKEATLQNDSFMTCECTHLSFFTGEVFVPPNKVDLTMPVNFNILVLENWLMVAIVLLLLFIWLLLMIWATFRDRKLEARNLICVLDDNIPGDSHVYLIVVFTGIFLDAGTTADVAFQIIGEKSKSRIHLIKCHGVNLLRRNAQDWFIIYTPELLGSLQKIRLWHNCKGSKPHWYCQRVLVQHLKTNNQSCFIIDKWFSLVWGGGQIYREIPVSEEINLRSSKVLFGVKLETQIKDKHLWLSIFTRDAQSNFSTKERVSTAICMLFLSMLASAMFYGIPRRLPSASIDYQTNYFITYRQVIIVVEAALVTVPLGILIVLLFRNSRPRRKK